MNNDLTAEQNMIRRSPRAFREQLLVTAVRCIAADVLIHETDA